MPLDHTPLDIALFSPAAQKVMGAGPMRMMAARGLAPIPDAGELVAVLYQLAIAGDEIGQIAERSLLELPRNILLGALRAELDPRVLDYVAIKLASIQFVEALEAIILNQVTADETIATLASTGSAPMVDLIAQNEQRLLRSPSIIGAMYKNRDSRMSTVDRAVELAIFNHVKVEEIAAWDELVLSVKTRGKRSESQPAAEVMDSVFAEATAGDASGGGITEVGKSPAQSTSQDEIKIHEMTVPMKIRLATLGTKFHRGQLIRDPIRMVALAAIKAPGMSDAEAAKYAGNNALHEDVIAYISRQREWTKLYTIKNALVNNPKTSLPVAIRMIPHLRSRDLRLLARSKGVPSALSAAARQLIANRSGGNK